MTDSIRRIFGKLLVFAAAFWVASGVFGAFERCEAAEPKPAEAVSVTAINAVTFDLYRKLAKDGENLCFSPYSISTCFAMAYAGARGETASEMERGLRYSPDIHASHRALNEMLRGASSDIMALDVANSIWPRTGFQIKQDFIKTVREDYFSDVIPQDYAGNPDGAVKAINGWVEEKTRDRIKDLLEIRDVSPNTLMILINAIYFKAPWADEFDKAYTKSADFHISPARRKTVSLINRTGRYQYAEHDGVQVVEVPCRGNEFSLVFMLPEEGQLSRVEKNISLEWLDSCFLKSNNVLVDLYLPKFIIEQKFEERFKDAIISLGVKTAFKSYEADFTGIADSREIYIGKAIHQTFMEVNEEGAEAAAATAIVMGLVAVGPDRPTPILFRADRPFIYLIRHNKSGTILFAGRVVDPTADNSTN